MVNKCVVVGCQSGYETDRKYRAANNLPQLSLFQPPSNMLETWEKIVSREGWKMKTAHRICELHFEEKDIISLAPLDIPGCAQKPLKRLRPGAIPTILPSQYPSYKVPKQVQKRKAPGERKASSAPKKRKACENDANQQKEIQTPNSDGSDLHPVDADMESPTENAHNEKTGNFESRLHRECGKVQLPDTMWAQLKNDAKEIIFTHTTPDIRIDRYVKFAENSSEPKVFFEGREVPNVNAHLQSFKDVPEFLMRVHALVACPGCEVDQVRSNKCSIVLMAKQNSSNKPPPRCRQCFLTRQMISRKKKRAQMSFLKTKTRIRKARNTIKAQKAKISKMEEKILQLAEKYDGIEEKEKDKIIGSLPAEHRLVVESCISAAKAKSKKGRRYTTSWVHSCILLRIKSGALYRKMLRENTIPLPSLRTLQRYIRKLRPAFGFSENLFSILKEKSATMDPADRRGLFEIDEMKLSVGTRFDKSTLKIDGFVDLGKYTPEESRDTPADHALVILFRPFRGQWFQVISAHLSKGSVPGHVQAKLITEATILTENSGFFVDGYVCDGATWNRNTWAEYGVQDPKIYQAADAEVRKTKKTTDKTAPATKQRATFKTKKSSKAATAQGGETDSAEKQFKSSCAHPAYPNDSDRRFWLFSDFPHLVKNVKRRVVHNETLQTPDGPVQLQHWRILSEEDSRKGIRLAPKLTPDHFSKDGFSTMKVKTSFSFFSEEVASAMDYYRKKGVEGLHDSQTTIKFIRRMNVLIDAMNANTKKHSITKESLLAPSPRPVLVDDEQDFQSRYGPSRTTTSKEVIQDFLNFLVKWEKLEVRRDLKLSTESAFGLRITLNSALELAQFLCREANFEYLMTRRLDQDRLENFFGNVREGCGSNAHPDPWQFIQVYRLLSVASLIRPPKGSNVSGDKTLKSLLDLPDILSCEDQLRRIQLEKELDEAIDGDEELHGLLTDHSYHENTTVEEQALQMFCGYVARKIRRGTPANSCSDCFQSLCAPEDQLVEEDSIIQARSKGYLLFPSDALYNIIRTLEITVLETLQTSHFHSDLIFEVVEHAKTKSFVEVGCHSHKRELTTKIMKFFLTTRIIFASKDFNSKSEEIASKKRKAKRLRKQATTVC